MKNIQQLALEKYKDATKYLAIGNGIFKDLADPDDTNHRLPVSLELEEGEDTQYPLEDVLDKYYIHVSDFYDSPAPEKILNIELAGELEDLQKASAILGKRVYNSEYVGEDGKTYLKLKID